MHAAYRNHHHHHHNTRRVQQDEEPAITEDMELMLSSMADDDIAERMGLRDVADLTIGGLQESLGSNSASKSPTFL